MRTNVLVEGTWIVKISFCFVWEKCPQRLERSWGMSCQRNCMKIIHLTVSMEIDWGWQHHVLIPNNSLFGSIMLFNYIKMRPLGWILQGETLRNFCRIIFFHIKVKNIQIYSFLFIKDICRVVLYYFSINNRCMGGANLSSGYLYSNITVC